MTAQYRLRLPDLSALPADAAAPATESLAAGLQALEGGDPALIG